MISLNVTAADEHAIRRDQTRLIGNIARAAVTKNGSDPKAVNDYQALMRALDDIGADKAKHGLAALIGFLTWITEDTFTETSQAA